MVPFRLMSGGLAALALPISQLFMVSCAGATVANARQVAINRVSSFFIEFSLADIVARVTSAQSTEWPRIWMLGGSDGLTGYFSRATTNSGAQSRARLISESGNVQMALRADSAYCVAAAAAASPHPLRPRISRISAWETPLNT